MTKQNSTAAVAYVRVSTGEQVESGAGMAAQRAAIEAEAARRGWQIVEWHADEGVSGAKGIDKRPGLSAAVDAIEAGRAGILLAAKLDRLSRSTLTTAQLAERAQRKGWQVVTVDAAGIDTSTPMGEAMVGQMAVFAQLERRLISQRTREALAEKRAQGVRLGRPGAIPAEVLRRIMQERAEGGSLRAIADGLTADEVPTARGGQWRASTVKAALAGQDAAALTAA